jgi:hypothetical protein
MCTMFGNQGMNPVRNQLATVDVPYFLVYLSLANIGSQSATQEARKIWNEMMSFSHAINPGELDEMVESAIKMRQIHLERPWKEFLQLN